MVVFTNTKEKINESDISRLEDYVGLIFPNEYKSHLLQYNGGQCTPNVFSFYENGQLTDSLINWFLAIHEGKYDNLKRSINHLKKIQKRLPNQILPIADDPLGNLICISCEGEDNGYIYFWDHENEVDYSVADDSDYSNLYLIAQSLSEFFDGLTELKDDEDIEE